MKQFSKKLTRTLIFLTAILLGVGITYGISSIGDKSKGPLTVVMEELQKGVYKVENKITLSRRENKRIQKLKWFDEFRDNKEKLIHPKFILLGASDASVKNSYENIIDLEDSLSVAFPLIHIYSAWGSKPENEFPFIAVNTIHELGSVPVITWEPWITDFDEKIYKQIATNENRLNKSMLSIAYGKYDLYIKEWAMKAKEYGKPIFLRFGHEMNDGFRYPWGPQYNTPEEYVKGWQHVHDIFSYVGANNIIWMWSPHLSYGYFDEYYPGDKYVDIVDAGVLNYGTSVEWSEWWSFEELFGSRYDEIAKYGKPITISEFGSLSLGGDRKKWFAEALHELPKKYPAISAILFFHYSSDYTVTPRSVNWYIKNDKPVTDAIKKEFKSILKYKRY